MESSLTRRLAQNGVLAGAYAALTLLTSGLAFGPVQLRLAEALCLLPMLAPETVWGVTLGCLVSNFFSPVSALDTLVGTLATLLAALWTAHIRHPALAPLPMVLCNGLLVGALLAWVYTPETFLSGFALMAAQVALGELAVGYALGVPLILAIKRRTPAKKPEQP